MHSPEQDRSKQDTPPIEQDLSTGGLVRYTTEQREQLRDRVHAMHRYIPEVPPQDVAYDGDPERYVNRVRATFMRPSSQLIVYGNSYSRYRGLRFDYEASRPLSPLLEAWEQVHAEDIGRLCISGNLTQTLFRTTYWPFFRDMTKTIACAPRIQADMVVDQRREYILRGVPSQKRFIEPAITRGTITEDNVTTAENLLKEYRGTMKLPDFWRLSVEQQDEIIAHIGKECLIFWRYGIEYGSSSLLQATKPKIIPRPIKQLQTVIEAKLASITPKMSFQTFLQDPQRFDNLLKESGKSRAVDSQEDQHERFSQLIKGLEVNSKIAMASSQSERLNQRATKLILDEFVTIVAAQLKSTQPDPEAVTLMRWSDPRTDLTKKLLDNHHGNITNLTVTRLAVDETYTQEAFKDWDVASIPLGTIRRYRVEADLLISGYPPVPTDIVVNFYVQHSAKGPQIHKMAPGVASGEAARKRAIIQNRKNQTSG